MRGLGLKPCEFWALTPAELQLMLGSGGAEKPMGRARLTELMETFPDKMRGDGT